MLSPETDCSVSAYVKLPSACCAMSGPPLLGIADSLCMPQQLDMLTRMDYNPGDTGVTNNRAPHPSWEQMGAHPTPDHAPLGFATPTVFRIKNKILFWIL